jgi:hypothetical protein
MRFVIVVVQLLISAIVTAVVMPALLVAVPAARDQRVGVSLMAGLMAVSFAVVSLLWPRRKT